MPLSRWPTGPENRRALDASFDPLVVDYKVQNQSTVSTGLGGLGAEAERQARPPAIEPVAAWKWT